MISVITPIYGVEKHLQDYAKNMRRLQKEFGGIKEIILINNNTKNRIGRNSALDGLKNLKVIENKKNVGYGRACNQGMKIAKGKHMLILNPDVNIDGASLGNLISEMEKNKKANIVSCKLINEDGTLQNSCRRFPTFRALIARRMPPFRHIFREELAEYYMEDYDLKNPAKVDWVSGALMLMKQKYYFDERYFMYFEDVDLCRSIGGVYYYPSVSARHKAERESARSIKLLVAHLSSSFKYFLKFWFKKD